MSLNAPYLSTSQVLVTLDHLERVSTFQEFVQIFSQFGNEMVEFAHLTGDRQNVSGIHPTPTPAPTSSSSGELMSEYHCLDKRNCVC